MASRDPSKDHQRQNLMRNLIDVKKRCAGKKSSFELRDLACKAVEAGVTLSDVASAASTSTESIKRWMKRRQVRILKIADVDQPTQTSPDPICSTPLPTVSTAAVAVVEFGGITIHLFKS